MLKHKRNPNPKRVKLRSGWLKSAGLYWVAVDQFEDLMKFARVDAEITGKRRIRLDTENVAAITLTPVKKLIDISPPLKKPITVTWNGLKYAMSDSGEVRAKDASPSDEPILVELDEQSLQLLTAPIPDALRKAREMEGPMDDVYCGPFALVCGTISKDEFTREVVTREAEKMALDWESWQHACPRIMLDTELTGADIEKVNLILVGGPDENAVTRRLMAGADGFPLKIEGNTLRFGGREFLGDDLGIAMCYPNPFNPKRYVLIVAGTTWKGVYQLDAFRDKDYDYWIVDARSQCHPPADDVVLLKGYFNARWQVDDRYGWARTPETEEKAVARKFPRHLFAEDCPDDEVYLSDVVPKLAKGDFLRAGHDLNWFQLPITMGGKEFSKGLSTKVEIGIYRNDVFFDLNGSFKRLKATIGIEIRDESTLSELQWSSTGLVFYVLGDGVELYKSPPIGPYDDPIESDVPISGVNELWRKSFNKGPWHVKVDSVNWGDLRVAR